MYANTSAESPKPLPMQKGIIWAHGGIKSPRNVRPFP